jgi:cell division protein FtsI/penicillin-binding protein 2
MLGAYNTVANKGVYVAPSLVKATVDSSGKTTPAKAPASHRVLSEATAANLTDMLVSAVHEGTGTAAQVEGYTAAGKTGTARKPENGAYKPNAYVSSFVGFLPAESPRLSAIVVLDEPTRGDYFGGVVSAPVFASVASYAVRHFGIPPAAAPAAPGPEAPTTTLGASPRP